MSQDLVPVRNFEPNEIEAIKQTIAPGLNETELQLFLSTCKRTGLDPFSRQIYVTVNEWTDKKGKKVRKINIQSTVDGFRVIAERSGKYEGQAGPFWCGEDGKWRDVWLGKDSPMAAKVGVFKAGFREPLWAVARTDAYTQGTPIWNKMPEQMVAKCAESLALRKAFPNDLSGLYTQEEMGQAEVEGESEARRPSEQIKQRVIVEQSAKYKPLVADIEDSSLAKDFIEDELDKALGEDPPLSAYEELGGVTKPEPKTKSSIPMDIVDDLRQELERYKIGFGKNKGRTLLEIGFKNSRDYASWLRKNQDPSKGTSPGAEEFFEMVKMYEHYELEKANQR